MGALPVLELDDSSGPTESLPIIEYLEEPHPDPPMIGIEPLERVRVRERERFAGMSILNRITQIFVNTSPLLARRKQAPQAAEQARGAPAALHFMDQRIGASIFVAGPFPTIAYCTLFAAFEHAERADVHIDDCYHNLMRWYVTFGKRPSARA